VKSKFNRILSVVAITLIAVCASANSASAQSAYKGTFTLTQEARWGSAKLPAGDYSFVLESMAIPAKITVRGPNGSQFVTTVSNDRENLDRSSSLKIERRGNSRFVSEIYLAEIQLQLHYSVPALPKDELLAMGPVSTETVLIASAK
jgi:hypothetical protein